MNMPQFSAEATIYRTIKSYRATGVPGQAAGIIHAAVGRPYDLGIKLQYTPRPGRPPGRPPHPFPPLGPDDPWARPTYCDTQCLRQCREFFHRECGVDALCVIETMPICYDKCCVWA